MSTDHGTDRSRPGPDQLAIDGGDRACPTPLPTMADATGRTLGEEEIAALTAVVRSGMLSSIWGTETRALEADFATLYGAEYAVAASSGTAALHLAVGAVNPEPGDEIITSPISDFGTIIPILMQNAVPVFADVDPRTGILDPAAVEAAISPRTKAIIAVHLFGTPAPVVELARIAREHSIALIEDCAQAYLTEPEPGRYAGRYGDIGCFSLQQTKHITAGDGGLAITDNPDLARRMRLFADKGWPRDTGERTYLFLAANYRMTELQAAVARAQLVKLPGVVARRRRTGIRLGEAIADLAGVVTPPQPERCSFWFYPLVLDADVTGATIAEWAAALTAEGMPATAGYIPRPLYLAPVLAERKTYGTSGYPLSVPPAREVPKYAPGLCPIAERMLAETVISLGWNENYTDQHVTNIIAAIRKVHAAFAARVGTAQ